MVWFGKGGDRTKKKRRMNIDRSTIPSRTVKTKGREKRIYVGYIYPYWIVDTSMIESFLIETRFIQYRWTDEDSQKNKIAAYTFKEIIL